MMTHHMEAGFVDDPGWAPRSLWWTLVVDRNGTVVVDVSGELAGATPRMLMWKAIRTGLSAIPAGSRVDLAVDGGQVELTRSVLAPLLGIEPAVHVAVSPIPGTERVPVYAVSRDGLVSA
jgi:hypothetical protein